MKKNIWLIFDWAIVTFKQIAIAIVQNEKCKTASVISNWSDKWFADFRCSHSFIQNIFPNISCVFLCLTKLGQQSCVCSDRISLFCSNIVTTTWWKLQFGQARTLFEFLSHNSHTCSTPMYERCLTDSDITYLWTAYQPLWSLIYHPNLIRGTCYIAPWHFL